MRKLLLALGAILLLAWPVGAQDSVDTTQHYIQSLWAAYTPSGDDKEAEVEMPAWATGFVVSTYVDSCTGCAADYHIKSYYPGTSTKFDFVDNAGSISGVGWTCVIFHPASIDAATCTEIRVVPPTGTIIIHKDVTAGTISSAAWIRWIGNPKS